MKGFGVNLPEHIANPNPEIYFDDNYVTYDIETTNLDKGDPRNEDNDVLLHCWRERRSEVVRSLWANEYECGRVVRGIEDGSFLVAHNAKFELGWLKRAGVDLSRIVVWDTMIAEYVLLGNTKKPLGLDAIAKRYGIGQKENLVSKLIKGGVCPSEIPSHWLESYCKQDVNLTEEVFKIQLELLAERGLLPVMYTRCIMTPVLTDIEFRGMCIDAERVEDEYRRYSTDHKKIVGQMDEFTGGINLRSSKQVAEFIYDELGFSELKNKQGIPIRSAGGGRSTSKETLGKLKASNKRQREFLSLRESEGLLAAALSKSLDFFHGVANEIEEGIFLANFNQCVTATHRLSSSGKPIQFEMYKKPKSVQFQNFNRTFKRLFKARNDGWLIGETDASQLEYRVAVFLGQDEAGLRDITDGVDSHAFTASIIYEDNWDEGAYLGGDKEQKGIRTASKAHTFKPLYGGESGTESEQRYYRAFKDKHKDIAATQERWKREVLGTKKLKTVTGLEFSWPDTYMTRSGYITNSTSICNYPVQSFATADIMPIAITYLWHRIKAEGLRSFLVNTVHDSGIAEIHPEEVEKYSDIAELSFTSDVYTYLDTIYNIDFNVPLEAEVEIYTHWSDN